MRRMNDESRQRRALGRRDRVGMAGGEAISPGLDLETRGGRNVRRRGEREREKRAEDGRHHDFWQSSRTGPIGPRRNFYILARWPTTCTDS